MSKLKLDTKDIKNIIVALERSYPVDTWIINGIHIWPLIRSRLFIDLFYIGREGSSSSPMKSAFTLMLQTIIANLKSFCLYFIAYMSDSKNNAIGKAEADVIMLIPSVNRIYLNDKWYDRLVGPFIDAFSSLGMISFIFEHSMNGEYRVPRSHPSKFIQPAILWIAMKSRLTSYYRKPAHESLSGYADFLKDLGKRCPDVDAPGIGTIRFRAFFVRCLADYFKTAVNRLNPLTAMLTNYDSILGAAFILACRECGIPSVDIQHGLQGDDNLAYGSFTRVPDKGFEVLPSFFWCWSEYEADAIRRWNANVSAYHQPFVGGNLWLNIWTNNNNEIVRLYDTRIAESSPPGENSVRILYTPSIPADVHEWIFTAMNRSPDSYRWWIRLHPSNTLPRKTILEFLAKYGLLDRVDLDLPTELPLYALLRHADVNITSSSATAFEAREFGVPTILIDPTHLSYFTDVISTGDAVTAFNPDDLLAAIRSKADKKRCYNRAPAVHTLTNEEICVRFLTKTEHFRSMNLNDESMRRRGACKCAE